MLQKVRFSSTCTRRKIFIAFIIHSASAFYPEFSELSSLLGNAPFDSEGYDSKDESSRRDNVRTESFNNERHDYLSTPRHYDDEEDEYDLPTTTYSPSLDSNDALYSSGDTGAKFKRQEYFDSLSKKSSSVLSRPGRKKPAQELQDDMDVEASHPDYYLPQPKYSKRPTFDNDDHHFSKESSSLNSGFDIESSFKRRKPNFGNVDHHFSKESNIPSGGMDIESRFKSRRPDISNSGHHYSKESNKAHSGLNIESRFHPVPDYRDAGRFDEPKPLSRPKQLHHQTNSHITPTTKRVKKGRRITKTNPPSYPSPSYNIPKPKELSSPYPTMLDSSLPLKKGHGLKKYNVPKKISTDVFARSAYPDDGFPPKPLTGSFRQDRHQSGIFTDEKHHFLASTGYGKPIREQFHEQGMSGPHSYKFGYNTGDKDNPMARYEERDPDGMVRGSYSYVDPIGKLQVVHYESHPKLGFKTT